MPLVTVLYEDSKVGTEFPLHHLILRMVEDDVNGLTWKIRREVIDNPKRGVDKLLADVRITARIAGAGEVFALVDRDRVAAHLSQVMGVRSLPSRPSDAEIVAAMRGLSDAPTKLKVYFLRPNMEGLISAVEHCAPGRWSAEIESARHKLRLAGNSANLSRDVVLTEVAKSAMKAVRDCLRLKQPGLDAMAKDLSRILPTATIG